MDEKFQMIKFLSILNNYNTIQVAFQTFFSKFFLVVSQLIFSVYGISYFVFKNSWSNLWLHQNFFHPIEISYNYILLAYIPSIGLSNLRIDFRICCQSWWKSEPYNLRWRRSLPWCAPKFDQHEWSRQGYQHVFAINIYILFGFSLFDLREISNRIAYINSTSQRQIVTFIIVKAKFLIVNEFDHFFFEIDNVF